MLSCEQDNKWNRTASSKRTCSSYFLRWKPCWHDHSSIAGHSHLLVTKPYSMNIVWIRSGIQNLCAHLLENGCVMLFGFFMVTIQHNTHASQFDDLAFCFKAHVFLAQRQSLEDGKNWDRWLPFLLFAYREVPQASTGFHPSSCYMGEQLGDHWT